MNFYKSAALALDHLDKHQGSVKGSLAAAGVKTGSSGEAKRVLALVIETLKYRQTLLALLTPVPLLSLERLTFPRKTPPRTPSSQSLLLVLLHDLLFSSRLRIEASDKWPPKEAVLRHQARLKAELVKLQIKEGKSRKEDLARGSGGEGPSGGAVRWIRWNPNVDRHRAGDWSLAALHRHLQDKHGLERIEGGTPKGAVPTKGYFVDDHLSECLLGFEGGTTWWQGDEWYVNGAVILQDKASCLPSRVLMEDWAEEEGECLDATAAPGNKTSYVSALMGDSSKLYAFERSPARFKTLERMLKLAQCLNVEAMRADFTQSDPRDYANVTRILLDPSCSGSGIVNRLDYLLDGDTEGETDAKAERLEKLSAFQLQMILHAFKFPGAKRIVYSTCSIHPEEDEHVTCRALDSKIAKENGWRLKSRQGVLPTWPRRGRTEEVGGDKDLAEGMIRCLPEDRTNGFFVACFVRGDSPAQTPASRGEKRKKRKQPDPEPEAAVVGEPKELEKEETVGAEEGDSAATTTASKKARTQPKTSAQLERARRKKKAQRDKRREGAGES